MKFYLYKYPFLFLWFISLPASADDGAHEWLMKMDRAARTLNYEGTFVYQHGDLLETMRIIHGVSDGTVRERLVSLNGGAREIIRNEHGVRCYFSDKNSLVVEYRQAEGKNFPTIFPQQLSDLNQNYAIQLGGTGRVANRPTQLVVIKPKDTYRYGYQLWADKATGLLLKGELVNSSGKIIEQFMFTQLNSGISITADDLKPKSADKNSAWRREEGETFATTSPSWTVAQLPPGFKLSAHLTRNVSTGKKPMEHLVFSDGLAAVSVFVEKVENARSSMNSSNRIGAVHAYGKIVNQHQITVVGEVPATTIDMIGQSIKPLQ
jgi:sigma-E factor negative regulatory protein RseB